MDSQDYIVVAVKVASEEESEIIEAVVSDLPFDSFQFEDGDAPVLNCYVQASEFDESALKEALSVLPGPARDYEVSSLPAQNWNAEWEREGFTPIIVADAIVSPATASGTAAVSAIEAEDPAREFITIWLDPQMAFGTGHHHTTYMMMETMQSLRVEMAGKSVMDLGCGTAVLALLAAKLGAGEVHAVDIDAVAARSAEGNVRLNGYDFEVLCGDASALQPKAYDFLLANIHRNIIIADLPRYAEALRPGGRLLLSGFYDTDAPDIIAAASAAGFTLTASRSRESWCCLCLSFEGGAAPFIRCFRS